MSGTDAGSENPAWLDEIRLDPGPPFATMGIHSLSIEDWLFVDGRREADLRSKAELLDPVRSTVFVAEPGSQAGVWRTARGHPREAHRG